MATTRRALLGALLLTAGGVVAASRLADPRSPQPTPDDLLIDAAVTQKRAVVNQLVGRTDNAAATVTAQQQAHITALLSLRSAAPPAAAAATSSSPEPSAALSLAELSTQRIAQALLAHDTEVARILLLVAASEAVHARVLA